MKSIEKFLLSKKFPLFLFLVSWIFVFVIYFPGHRAMLIDDGISGIWEMKKEGMHGYFHTFGMKSFYYGYYLFLGSIYALFGTNPLGWFIVFSFFHALNTTFVFKSFQKIYTILQIKNAVWIALIGALLFLSSPYQSENIEWAATGHYAICMFVLLYGLSYISDFSENISTNKYLLIFHGLFIFALLTLEISFFFPIVFFGLFLLFVITKRNRNSFIQFLIKIILPQLLFVFIYLFLYYLKNGNWIPNRYDTPHSFVFSKITPHFTQQLVKLFSLIHFTEFPFREKIYLSFLHWKRDLLVLSALFLLISYFIYRKDKKNVFVFWYLIFAACVFLYPFVEQYFVYIFRYENDRFLYFGSVFLLQSFVLVLFYLKSFIRIPILLLYFIGFIYCIFQVVESKKKTAKLYYTFINKFPKINNEDKIYLLNVPNYCDNIYMFRSIDRLPISIEAEFGIDISKNITVIVSYAANAITDSFYVKKLNDSTINMKTITIGNWWMRESLGASSYENERYKFDLNEWGEYKLIFKHPLLPNEKIYYFNRGKFIQLQ